MSLFTLPVTAADLETLQLGIGFFTDPTAAASEAAAINAATPGGPTVYSYAVQLLEGQISLAQIAMADSALMEGVTVAAGSVAAPTPNTLALFTTQFLPAQVNFALANGFDPTVFAGQALGLALSTNAAFNTNYVSLSATAFTSAVATLTGLNANAISGWLANWTAFYTANPPTGASIQQAAYGATFGDAIGTALLNPTPIAPTNMPSGLPDGRFSSLQNEVYNALKVNAEGTYVAGVALGALPQETPLQGETGVGNGVFLTQNIDTSTAGFSLSPNGTPVLGGFTATTANTVLNALPFVASSGLSNNTLNAADNVQTTGAATGATTLNFTTSTDSGAANPAYARGVTINGVNTLNITNQTGGRTDISGDPGGFRETTAGFQGSVTGLTTVVNTASVNSVQLGAAGNALSTALATYASVGGSNQNFTAVIAGAALSGATDAIGVTLTGNTGAAANPASFGNGNVDIGGTSIKLVFAPDTGANGYETWNIASNNNAFLRLAQGVGTTANGDFGTGIGSANNLVLTGAGSVELNALTQGDFANLKTIDASAATGAVTLTGLAANTFGGYYSAVGADFNDVANEAGLLTSSATNIIAPTSIKGSTAAQNFVDLSGLTTANINAITTLTGNTATGVTNWLILPNTVVEQAGALAGESGFQVIGDTALRAGTINLANFTNANEIALFGPEAINVGAVTINNGTPTFTLALNGNTGGAAQPGTGPGAFLVGFHNFVVNQPSTTSTTDVFNLNMGTAAHTNSTGANSTGSDFAATANSDTIGFFGIVGDGLTVNGYETVNINVTDGPALPLVVSIFTNLTNVPDIIYGGIALTPTPGGGETLHLTGSGDLVSLINSVAGAPLANIEYEVGGVPVDANNFIINADETGIFAFGGTNALQVNGATSGGIVMVGGTDTNVLGATLTGSTTGWNALAGSDNADTFNGGTGQATPFAAVQGDVFGTNGGTGTTQGDVVNLAAGHTLNYIDIYPTDGDAIAQNGLNYEPLSHSVVPNANMITSTGLTPLPDQYQPGWAGVPTGGTAIQFGHEDIVVDVNGFSGGTSASQVIVNGFVTGAGFPGNGDVVHFSVSEWGFGTDTPANPAFVTFSGATIPYAAAIHNLGLVEGDAATAVPGGADAAFGLVTGGVGIIPVATTVVELSNIEPNANALAGFLHGAGGSIQFAGAGLAADTAAHMLFAYSDGANVHIADVEFVNTSAAAETATGAAAVGAHVDIIGATDMVQLTGVASVTALNAHNVHLLA